MYICYIMDVAMHGVSGMGVNYLLYRTCLGFSSIHSSVTGMHIFQQDILGQILKKDDYYKYHKILMVKSESIFTQQKLNVKLDIHWHSNSSYKVGDYYSFLFFIAVIS